MRKLGEALKAVVSEGYESDEEAAGPTSALMNENRRRVFEYVAWHPCCTAAEVARALRSSGPTAAWHLKKLRASDYVHETKRGRFRRYHIAGLGLSEEEIEGLTALADADAAKVLALAVETPGLTGAQLAKRLGRSSARKPTRALLGTGLLVSVADGRFRRYFPGNAVAAIERSAPKRLRNFRRRFVRRLERDRLAPVARTAPGDVLEVEIRFGDERTTLRLPMESLLAKRLA